MGINLKLFVAIKKSNFNQKSLADAIPMTRSYLNLAINRGLRLDDGQKRSIAKALGQKVEDLFDE